MDDLLGELHRRRNFIDGVGHLRRRADLDPQLLPLLRQIQEMGLQVKLDTNGLAWSTPKR
ncbi:MAG: hypothetical protein R2864_00410 [Syntrophotaleaceae bacterium]